MLSTAGPMQDSAWFITPDAEFPLAGSPGEKLEYAARCVCRHPEVDETGLQLVMVDDHLELCTESPHFFGEEREGIIRGGTALQHLKLKLKQHGCLGRVELFPELDRPALIARVHVGTTGFGDPIEAELFSRSCCRRSEWLSTSLPLLTRWLSQDRGWLDLAESDRSRECLQSLIHPPEHLQLQTVRLRDLTWVRTPAGNWDAIAGTAVRPPRRFPRWRPTAADRFQTLSPQPVPAAASETVTPRTTLAVFKTKTDDKRGWLAAGQALARLAFHSLTFGLSTKHYLKPLRDPAQRERLRTSVGHKGFAQAIVGFFSEHCAGNADGRAVNITSAVGGEA